MHCTRMRVLLLRCLLKMKLDSLHVFLTRIPPCSDYADLTFTHCVAVYIYICSGYLFYQA